MGGFKPGGVSDHLQLTNIGIYTHDEIDNYLDTSSISESSQTHYVDSARPDDTGDGSSWATAFKSISTGIEASAYKLYHDTSLICRGTFDITDYIYVRKNLFNDVRYVIDATDALTIIDDNAGANYTPTAATTGSITVSGAGWTPNEFAGYIYENTVTSDIKLIQENTTDTIYIAHLLGVAPTADDFRIMERGTIIRDDNSYKSIRFDVRGSGSVYLQRFNLQNRAYVFITPGNETYCYLVGNNFKTTNFALSDFNRSGTLLDDRYIDPITFGISSERVGTSFITNGASVKSSNPHEIILDSCVSNEKIELFGINQGRIFGGFCFNDGLESRNNLSNDSIQNSSGYNTGKIRNSAGDGLLVEGHNIEIEDAIDISNCSSHGIVAKNGANIYLSGAVTGSGNTDHGAACFDGGRIITASGVTPTATGTNGNIKENATTKAWAAGTNYGPVYADEVVAGDSYAGHEEDEPPASTSYNNEFDGSGTGWSWDGGGGEPTAGGEGWQVDNKRMLINFIADGGTFAPQTTGHQYMHAAPAGNFIFWAKVDLLATNVGNFAGIIIQDDAENNCLCVGLQYRTATQPLEVAMWYRSGGGSWTYSAGGEIVCNKRPVFSIKYNSAGSYIANVGLDQSQVPYYKQVGFRSGTLTTPKYGILCQSESGSDGGIGIFEWIRLETF